MDVVFAQGVHWVAQGPHGWLVIYREATRLGLVGYPGDQGLAWAVWYVAELERRLTAPSQRG